MKKITFYQFLNVILIAIYLGSLVVQRFTPLFHISLEQYWFPTFCLFLGVSMLFKTIIFKSDSSLWLSVALLLVAVGLYAVHAFSLPVGKYWVVVLSILSVASLTVGLVFREIYQVKLFFVFNFISIPLYLYLFQILTFWWCLLILVACIYASIVISRVLPERWYAKH